MNVELLDEARLDIASVHHSCLAPNTGLITFVAPTPRPIRGSRNKSMTPDTFVPAPGPAI